MCREARVELEKLSQDADKQLELTNQRELDKRKKERKKERERSKARFEINAALEESLAALDDEDDVESMLSHGLSNADVKRWVETVNNPQITTTQTVNNTNILTQAFNGTNQSARASGLVNQTVTSGGPVDPLVPMILVCSTNPQQDVSQGVEVRYSNPIINMSFGIQSKQTKFEQGWNTLFSSAVTSYIQPQIN
jgi:hypothetical protein